MKNPAPYLVPAACSLSLAAVVGCGRHGLSKLFPMARVGHAGLVSGAQTAQVIASRGPRLRVACRPAHRP
jgi:hypothetical protein